MGNPIVGGNCLQKNTVMSQSVIRLSPSVPDMPESKISTLKFMRKYEKGIFHHQQTIYQGVGKGAKLINALPVMHRINEYETSKKE